MYKVIPLLILLLAIRLSGFTQSDKTDVKLFWPNGVIMYERVSFIDTIQNLEVEVLAIGLEEHFYDSTGVECTEQELISLKGKDFREPLLNNLHYSL